MSTSLEVKITKALVEPGVFSAEFEVLSATGIDPAVFVYSAASEMFSHVAKLFDMATFPDTLTPGVPFYRQPTVTQTRNKVLDATAFVSYTQERLQSLLNTYEQGAIDYPSEETITLEGEAQ